MRSGLVSSHEAAFSLKKAQLGRVSYRNIGFEAAEITLVNRADGYLSLTTRFVVSLPVLIASTVISSASNLRNLQLQCLPFQRLPASTELAPMPACMVSVSVTTGSVPLPK